MIDQIVMCMSSVRWTGCKLKKNLCCAQCWMLEDCTRDYAAGIGNRARPCSKEEAEDCECAETLR